MSSEFCFVFTAFSFSVSRLLNHFKENDPVCIRRNNDTMNGDSAVSMCLRSGSGKLYAIVVVLLNESKAYQCLHCRKYSFSLAISVLSEITHKQR